MSVRYIQLRLLESTDSGKIAARLSRKFVDTAIELTEWVVVGKIK
jgi:hypothetical protein